MVRSASKKPSYKLVSSLFHLTVKSAASKLDISKSHFRKICKAHGINRFVFFFNNYYSFFIDHYSFFRWPRKEVCFCLLFFFLNIG